MKPSVKEKFLPTTLARIQALLPEIAKRSGQIEQERRIPDDLVAVLRQAGCYRMFAPARYGGDALPLPEALKVIEALSCADGATGWTASQVASSQLIFSYFPEATIQEMYSAGPDLMGAGAVAPKGQAVAQEGGWRVSGQWPFVSGSEHATWFYVQCLVVENRKVQMLPSGAPAVRMMLFPAREVQILDTWHVIGLQGTASHDICFSGAFCPHEHSANMMGSRPTLEDPVFSIPLLDQGGLFIAAVAVGIAQGALDEVTELAAGGKRPSFTRERLSQSAVFQDRVGEAYLQLQGARALLYAQAETAWAAATNHSQQTLLERATLRATPAAVMGAATRIVDTAYTLAGGTSVYQRCPLQRRLRDIHAATQHVYAGRHSFAVVGALVAQEKIDESLF